LDPSSILGDREPAKVESEHRFIVPEPRATTRNQS
jgi:hypothetical protein